jgi:hypothetical protein
MGCLGTVRRSNDRCAIGFVRRSAGHSEPSNQVASAISRTKPLDVLEADDQFLDDARPDLILVLDPSRMGTRLVG